MILKSYIGKLPINPNRNIALSKGVRLPGSDFSQLFKYPLTHPHSAGTPVLSTVTLMNMVSSLM